MMLCTLQLHPITEGFQALGGMMRASQTKLGIFGPELAIFITLAAMLHTFSDAALVIAPWCAPCARLKCGHRK